MSVCSIKAHHYCAARSWQFESVHFIMLFSYDYISFCCILIWHCLTLIEIIIVITFNHWYTVGVYLRWQNMVLWQTVSVTVIYDRPSSVLLVITTASMVIFGSHNCTCRFHRLTLTYDGVYIFRIIRIFQLLPTDRFAVSLAMNSSVELWVLYTYAHNV